MTGGAVFSESRIYRYRLDRVWSLEAPLVLIIGLNPSTADERTDDPMVRRCLGFARRWGFGGLMLGNLFAIRCTDPNELERWHGPMIGVDNDHHLVGMANTAAKIVCAWGRHLVAYAPLYNNRAERGRAEDVLALLADRPLWSLGVTKKDHRPRHPLYLGYDEALVRFRPSHGSA